MRYLVALIIGIGVLFGINFFADLFSMPRPWGSLLMGAIVGITMVVVLLVWEVVKPSHRDTAPATPAMSEEERANARAERRARLAADAGVSIDDDEGSGAKAKASSTEPRVPPIPPAANEAVAKKAEVSPDADESSIEAEPKDTERSSDHNGNGSNDSGSQVPEVGRSEEPDSLTHDESTVNEPRARTEDEVDAETAGSSLENPPTGEPGISVDALNGSEPAPADKLESVDDTDDPSANDGTSKY
ncbi:hypothetical protein [Brevibacterium aurantiacum]|uniref:Uncharacterized protein n=1 Tax=Brevibacterium aurantiacum TaxID=273384 RepID=A0A556C772_BREAU|nr:hypothetical protein [Brevibacterium aurantiacum]TSI13293.1 hypothetical protein FO013_17935 [Brevibacterium aurantiacum]